MLIVVVAGLSVARPCYADSPPPQVDAYGQLLPDGASARLGKVLFGLRGTPVAVAWSPDGKKLAAVSNHEPYLHVWEWPSGKTLLEIRLPDATSGNLLFSPDGQLLFWTDGYVRNNFSRLWKVQDASEISTPESIRNRCGAATFSGDSKRLAFAERDHDVVEWTLGTDAIRVYKGTNAPDQAIVYTEQNELLTATSTRTSILVKNASKDTELLKLQSEEVFHTSLAFSPDGKWLAYQHGRSKVIIREIDGNRERTISLKKADITSNITFTPDSKCVAVNLIGDMEMLELESGNSLYAVTDFPFRKPVFRPDAKIFAGCWGRESVAFFDAKTAKELPTVDGHRMRVQGSLWTADNKEVLTWSRSEVIVWNAQDGKLVRTGQAIPNFGGMRWTSDHRSMVTAGPKRETQIQVWDAKTLERTRVYPNLHRYLVGCFAISSDDKQLVTGSAGTTPDQVMLWDLKTGQKLWKVPLTSNFAQTVEFLSGDEDILLVEHEVIRIVHCDPGQEGISRELLRVMAPEVAISCDRKLLAITQAFDSNQWKGRTRIVEIATGKEVIELGREFEGRSVVLSPDGRTCFVGGKDNQIHVFNVSSGKEISVINTGCGVAFSVSPDGRLLVCPGKGIEAMTPLVWDVAKWTRRPRVASDAASEAQVQLWCNQLIDPEPIIGIAAVWNLADNPILAIPALREKFARQPKSDPNQLAKLINELGDPKFQVRESATAELTRQGLLARAAIENALGQNPSPEQQKRLVAVRNQILDARSSPELLFAARSIMVLDQIRSKEAKELLDMAARGDPAARLTLEAKAALGRWKSEHGTR